MASQLRSVITAFGAPDEILAVSSARWVGEYSTPSFELKDHTNIDAGTLNEL